VGTTEAIALDTDRVVPDELRPNQDTQTTSFINAQKLYKTARNFLYKLENTEKELANIIGGDFIDIATRAIVFNGVNVTYQNNEPYSFEWEGLRIDSSAKVNYFNRFHSDTSTHSKEFSYIFGLEASQNESDIFEEQYNIESIATTKGLKLVSQNQFINTTLFKISSQNESIINTLTNISENTRNIFHTAVQEGNTIYVPNRPVTYGNWNGLFYININPLTGSAGYIIGEGLNGSYTVEQWPSGWSNFWRSHLLPGLVATIATPLAGQVFQQGDIISWSTSYNSALLDWNEELKLDSKNYKTGTIALKSGYGTNASVGVEVQKKQLGDIYIDFDAELINIANEYSIPPDLLKSVIYQESIKEYDEKLGQYAFQPRSYRYEAHKDYDWYSGPSTTAKSRIEKHPEKYFAIGGQARHGTVPQGVQVPPKSEYLSWSRYMSGYRNGLNVNDGGDGNLTAQELLDNNQDKFWKTYKGPTENWDFTAQLLLASSYGLGQVMYNTALTRGFDTTSSNERARPITDLFDPEVGIRLTASYLVDKYSGNWFNAVFLYNGAHDDPDPSVYDSVHYAEEVMKRWNNGNGSFKLLIINN
jgi:hypothetical protein